MRSMTGFGRGTAERGEARATVDVRAVNHRFLDLKLRGASLPPALEEAVTARVRGTVERGSVIVSLRIERGSDQVGARIDDAAAARAHARLTQLARTLGTAAPDLALVLQQPGVLVGPDFAAAEERETVADSPVLPALDAALLQLVEMRETEGRSLGVELTARLDELTAVRAQVAALAATVPAQVAKRLQERVRKLAEHLEEGATIDPGRLVQEIALLADRGDVTEELVRLASHLDQCRSLVDSKPAAIGRRLDFLVQELGRELNTIGSKSAAAEITTAIVAGKAALEKLREQVQNVE